MPPKTTMLQHRIIRLQAAAVTLPSIAAHKAVTEFKYSPPTARQLLADFIQAGEVKLHQPKRLDLAQSVTAGYSATEYEEVPRSIVGTRRFNVELDDFEPEPSDPSQPAGMDFGQLQAFSGIQKPPEPAHTTLVAPARELSKYRVDYPQVQRAFKEWKSAAKNPGGTPAIFEWDRAMRDLLRRLGQGWKPKNQEAIATAFAEWFITHDGPHLREEPAAAARRERAGELLRALNAYANGVKPGGKT